MLNHRNQAPLPLAIRVKISMLLATSALLSGCAGDDISDLQNYVAQVKSQQKGAVEPLPEIKTVEPFVFNGEELRDPFIQSEKTEQPEEVKSDNGVRPDTARAKEELEAYELDSLRMVGTVTRDNMLWGLVRASDGTIHRVRAGNYMGRNFGKIIRVREGQIELLEIIPDAPGSWRERKASLDMVDAGGNH